MAKKSPKVEITARITMPDGQVIESVASGDGNIPLPKDFDNSTREGFLRDFDALESSIISARDKATSEIGSKKIANLINETLKKKLWIQKVKSLV